jgi:chemotaxis protein CheY-P-specific phosphatase CheC
MISVNIFGAVFSELENLLNRARDISWEHIRPISLYFLHWLLYRESYAANVIRAQV